MNFYRPIGDFSSSVTLGTGLNDVRGTPLGGRVPYEVHTKKGSKSAYGRRFSKCCNFFSKGRTKVLDIAFEISKHILSDENKVLVIQILV